MELLWEMGPKPELDEWGERNPYGQELAELAFVSMGVGLGLLIFYALYRCCLSCRACCCKEKMCTCVETKTKGKGGCFSFSTDLSTTGDISITPILFKRSSTHSGRRR